MDQARIKQLNLGAIDQLGFVYKDINAAVALYEPIFGPFEIQRFGEMEWDYRGEPNTSEIIMAMGNSGDIEIELIQWVSGSTPHKEFIDAGREGMHHIRFPVENLEEKLAKMTAHGYRAIWKKSFAEGVAAAYLERKGDPLLIELFENIYR